MTFRRTSGLPTLLRAGRLPLVVDLLKALQQSLIAGGLFLLIGSLKRAWIRLFAKINPGTACQGFVASSGIEPESRASETRILSVVLRGQLSEQEGRCIAIDAKVMFHPLLTQFSKNSVYFGLFT